MGSDGASLSYTKEQSGSAVLTSGTVTIAADISANSKIQVTGNGLLAAATIALIAPTGSRVVGLAGSGGQFSRAGDLWRAGGGWGGRRRRRTRPRSTGGSSAELDRERHSREARRITSFLLLVHAWNRPTLFGCQAGGRRTTAPTSPRPSPSRPSWLRFPRSGRAPPVALKHESAAPNCGVVLGAATDCAGQNQTNRVHAGSAGQRRRHRLVHGRLSRFGGVIFGHHRPPGLHLNDIHAGRCRTAHRHVRRHARRLFRSTAPTYRPTSNPHNQVVTVYGAATASTCSAASDCGAGYGCFAGHCALAVTGAINDSSDPAAVAVTPVPPTGSALSACSTDADCAAGWSCYGAAGFGSGAGYCAVPDVGPCQGATSYSYCYGR